MRSCSRQASRLRAWNWRSPKRRSFATSTGRSPRCGESRSSVCALRWTTSAPATRRCRTCAPSRSTRSRSTARSSNRSMSTTRALRSCDRCSGLAARSISTCWPRVWRPVPSSIFSRASYATRRRAFCSAGRHRDLPPPDQRRGCQRCADNCRLTREQGIVRLAPCSAHILCHAIAEGPVLLGHFDQVDEHVLAAQADPFVETIHHGLVERLLLLYGAARAEGELDEHAVLRALDPKIVFIGDVVFGRVLGDDLETIIRWRLQDADDRFIDDVANRALVVRRLAADEVDAGQRHLLLQKCEFNNENSRDCHAA